MNDILATFRKRTAPLWPLRRFVAVNPFSGYRDLPFAEASRLLAASAGGGLTRTPAFYRAAYESGEIAKAALDEAAGDVATRRKMIALLHRPDAPVAGFPASFAAHIEGRLSPRDTERFLVRQISLVCATHYDRNQAAWTSPWKNLPLYAAWRERLRHDRNAEAFGLSGFSAAVAALPPTAEAMIRFGVERLRPPALDTDLFLMREMRALAGWSGYLAYLEHEASIRGESRAELEQLVAVRLACETALLQVADRDDPAVRSWFAQRPPEVSDDEDLLARWQTAYESGHIARLAATFVAGKASAAHPSDDAPIDAVFCIDVRSERLRRHLEGALPSVRTHGFAGFFGFPVSHSDAQGAGQPRCPVLLAPPLPSGAENPGREDDKDRAARAWTAFQNSAASCFSFVEVGGPLAAFSLLRDRRSRTVAGAPPKWADGVSPEALAETAAGALRNMGLDRAPGRLVLLCGHGAHSSNNPHAASLECGACGGHAGDVNARLAADTFNDPEIRRLLARRGTPIPEATRFLAGMHVTQTDEVVLYDTDKVPASHAGDLRRLRDALVRASARTRAERAGGLGLGTMADDALLRLLQDRGADPGEVRPEWALAGNAAFVAAPRARTAGIDLQGRCFLQDYDHAADTDGSVLKLILSAPVVVASWINLQYYASTLRPDLWGAGDKTLHQVVAGIGVVEGNGGDLRTGLPLQSVHDGERFVHETRRLAVFVEAPRSKIDSVLGECPDALALFSNGWLHLIALDAGGAYRRTGAGDWVAAVPAASPHATTRSMPDMPIEVGRRAIEHDERSLPEERQPAVLT